MASGAKDLGGTIRALPAAETLAWLTPLLPRFGITRVARLTGLDHLGVPVSTAIRPLSRLLLTAQGKGLSPELADISAIMEAIETWHAERVPRGPCRAAAALLAQGRRVVAPESLRPLQGLSRPLRPDTELEWVPAHDLLADAEVLLPRAYLDLDTTDRAAEEKGQLFSVTTTGLAAGNTEEEAILHGLYEVLERDAHCRFLGLPPDLRAARRLDLATVAAPALLGLLSQLGAAGMRLQVFDMSGELPVPVFLCRLLQPDATSRWFVNEGAGAHGRPEIALYRAITEAVQSRLSYIAGSRDDLYPHMYAGDLVRAQLAAGTDLTDDAPGGRDLRSCPAVPEAPGLAEQLDAVLKLLRGAGIGQVLVYRHTRAELGVPVVHVVCPGLCDVAG